MQNVYYKQKAEQCTSKCQYDSKRGGNGGDYGAEWFWEINIIIYHQRNGSYYCGKGGVFWQGYQQNETRGNQ